MSFSFLDSNKNVSQLRLRNTRGSGSYLSECESDYTLANGPFNEKNEYSNLDGTDVLKDCDVLLLSFAVQRFQEKRSRTSKIMSHPEDLW